nr:sister chromatid cohesion protein PDS5-like isoform X1 [Tanacetum cinerariifolium]
MTTIIFVGLRELMGYFGRIQVAQKKVKIAFENADSSSRVELIPSKTKYANKVVLNFHKEFSVFLSFTRKGNDGLLQNNGVLPVARELGEGVLWKSAEKLKPYLMQAVSALGDPLDTYTEIVTSVSGGKTATFQRNDENHSQQSKELASPKQTDLEQMATGKEISNPFMAGSLPKTTLPTSHGLYKDVDPHEFTHV